MSRRMARSVSSSSSSPIRNSSITTPSSATGDDALGLSERREPVGADDDAGDQIGDDRGEPGEARNRHADHRRGEQHQARASRPISPCEPFISFRCNSSAIAAFATRKPRGCPHSDRQCLSAILRACQIVCPSRSRAGFSCGGMSWQLSGHLRRSRVAGIAGPSGGRVPVSGNWSRRRGPRWHASSVQCNMWAPSYQQLGPDVRDDAIRRLPPRLAQSRSIDNTWQPDLRRKARACACRSIDRPGASSRPSRPHSATVVSTSAKRASRLARQGCADGKVLAACTPAAGSTVLSPGRGINEAMGVLSRVRREISDRLTRLPPRIGQRASLT